MLAARWCGRGDIRIEDIPDLDDPGPGWVRLRIKACGICGTDVEEYTSGPVLVPTTPNALSKQCAPLTLGHEAVGVIEARGAGVDLAEGTLVAIEGNLFCGTCWWCRRHEYQLCEQLAGLGLMGDGGLAEAMLAPAYMCLPFESDVAAEHAVFAEPLSVAVRAATRAGIGLGTTVGVLGAGTVGLLTIQAARLAGARSIVAIERHARRRQLALDLGADLAVAPEDADAAADQLTRGIGLDVTIEAAGNAAAGAAAIKLARRGGRTVLLGVFDDAVPVDMLDFLLGEKTVLASLSHVYDSDFATAVALIDRGAVQLDPLITDRIRLVDVVEKGFKTLVAEPEEHLKIVVLPNGS